MPQKAAKYPAARSAVQEARRLVIMNLERVYAQPSPRLSKLRCECFAV